MRTRSSIGRWTAAFVALASLVVTPGVSAYVRPGTTEEIDRRSDGRRARERELSPDRFTQSTNPDVGGNGRFVAFVSTYPDLVPGDSNGAADIFVRDRKVGSTEMVSVGVHGLPAQGLPHQNDVLSIDPSISSDGRFVAFSSWAENLVKGDTNQTIDVFVFDRKTGEMERVSVDSGGRQTRPDAQDPFSLPASMWPSISAGGRYVSFTSHASNLVPRDTNATPDVFVHDRRRGRTQRVSVASGGRQSDACASTSRISTPTGSACLFSTDLHSSISANGRYVAFDSPASDLVPDSANDDYDVFVHDRETRTTELVSVASDGTPASDPPHHDWCPGASIGCFTGSRIHCCLGDDSADAISANGRYVVFASFAGNLVPNDVNATTPVGGYDIFVHDRRSERTERISVSSYGEEEQGSTEFDRPSISADGRFVMFGWLSNDDIEISDEVPDPSTFIYDRKVGLLDTPGRLPNGTSAGGTRPGGMSMDGRYVAVFGCLSRASGGPGDPCYRGDTPCECYHVWLRDRGPDLGLGKIAVARPADPIAAPDIPGFDADGYARVTEGLDVAVPARGIGAGDLIGARVAYRPTLRDLYVALDVESLSEGGGASVAGQTVMLYGLRLDAGGIRYELRAQRDLSQIGRAKFGLFRCIDGDCEEVARLRGGYGTAGDSVIMPLPLKLLGSRGATSLRNVEAFSAYGSYELGPLKGLDELRLSQ